MIITVISYIGMVCCLLSVLAANSKGSFHKAFNWFVVIGGICLTLYAVAISSVPFIILNGTYGSLGVYALIKTGRKK